MSTCRTCLSKNDLKPIFPDKDLANSRATELYLVTGIKIETNDGLTQLICIPCTNLVNGALLLRKQSSHSNVILRKRIRTNQSSSDVEISDRKHKKKTISEHKDFEVKVSVKIEDFESSEDSQTINDATTEDLESGTSDDNKVCIEDFESSENSDDNDIFIKEEPKPLFKAKWERKEKEFLEREKRKSELRELDTRLMSLAVSPYSPEGPITCAVCSSKLSSLRNFKCHAKTHFERQNACEECGKKFVNRNHMQYHQQRVHGKLKRLACPYCSYRAVDPQQLLNHKRASHTGEKPYVCDVCGDKFRMRANIVQHMRKHFGVRNLQCERCPSMFRSRSELTNHQNRVHKHIYTYFCYMCTEIYKKPASVRKHLVNIHGVPKNQQHSIKCVKTTRSSCEKTD